MSAFTQAVAALAPTNRGSDMTVTDAVADVSSQIMWGNVSTVQAALLLAQTHEWNKLVDAIGNQAVQVKVTLGV